MIDPATTAAAPGAIKLVYDLAKDIVSFASHAGKKEFAKLSVDLETGFGRFLARNLRQHTKVKTLLNPSKPIAVDSVFVSPSVEYDDQSLDETSFIALIEEYKFVVLTGMGGSGKSMFLKHLFVRYHNEPRGKIPFLIELRNIPKDTSIKDYILKQLKGVSTRFDVELLDYALASGKFIFLFDGFDEIELTSRGRVSQEIIDLTYAFDENIFVLTSRPDNIFGSWTEFHIAKMKGFSAKQAVELLKKLKYDKTARHALIDLIKTRGLYTTHSAYLANPLLCTIMLLTFDQGADIPDKMHLFFSQTFDVLFYRHDATKGTAFRRKFATTLSIDEFRSVTAAFSAFTYSDSGPTMKRLEALNASGKALQLANSSDKPADFMHDLCSSVSVMIREGDVYSFIHRSFQEYFVAIFLATRDHPNWMELIEKIMKTRPNDTVINLLADINRDKFEQSFLYPSMQNLCAELVLIDESTRPNKIFNLFYYDIGFDKKYQISWTIGRNNERPEFSHLLSFIGEEDAIHPLVAFNWESHFNAKGLKYPTDGTRPSFEADDPFFDGTPLLEFLKKLKRNALARETELGARISEQRELITGSLLEF